MLEASVEISIPLYHKCVIICVVHVLHTVYADGGGIRVF